MATGLRLATERTGEGAGQPLLDADDGEELMHVQPGVSIVLGNRPPESPGTLYISTKQLVWLSDTDRAKGYAVDFLSVSLHAVSRDPEAYPSPCIYTQIDTGAEDDESEDSDSECNDTLDLSKITEMRFVPLDPNQLDTLFAVFCECAELNPGPIEEEEVEHNWVFSAGQFEDGASDDEDSDLVVSQNQTHSIGANVNHDIARSVLQHSCTDISISIQSLHTTSTLAHSSTSSETLQLVERPPPETASSHPPLTANTNLISAPVPLLSLLVPVIVYCLLYWN